MSLRLKASLLILVPMVLILAVSGAISYTRQRERALSSMSLLASQTGQVIEDVLVQDMLLADFESIQATFNAIGEDERARTLYLLDPSGHVIFSPRGQGTGLQLSKDDETCQECHLLPPEDRPSGIVVNIPQQGPVFRSMIPIENRAECSQCHDPDQRLLGLLLTDFSVASIEDTLRDDLRTNLAWWAGTLVATAILANLAIDRLVLRRLSTVSKAITAFGQKEMPSQLPEEPGDEIGELGAAFNAMASVVEQRRIKIEGLTRALREQAEARGDLLKRVISAQEEERKRVARELHDDLGQAIGSTALSIELARRNAKQDPTQADRYLAQAHELLSEASDQMYDLILGLRPSVLDDLGLLAAIKMQAGRCLDPACISYRLESEGLGARLPPEIETVLFRIFQEALTNIARHSQASQVMLRVAIENGCVIGEVEDNGVGFNTEEMQGAASEAAGFGLLGMRERVAQCGGKIEIVSNPGAGTQVRVRIPLSEVQDG